MKKKEKLVDIVSLAKDLIIKGSYAISKHAYVRQGERSMNLGDIKNIIFTGYHEKRKDQYKEEFQDWSYAIKGSTLDGEQARVCITFIEKVRFIVITVIRLEV